MGANFHPMAKAWLLRGATRNQNTSVGPIAPNRTAPIQYFQPFAGGRKKAAKISPQIPPQKAEDQICMIPKGWVDCTGKRRTGKPGSVEDREHSLVEDKDSDKSGDEGEYKAFHDNPSC
jgi:hypothetical protein